MRKPSLRIRNSSIGKKLVFCLVLCFALGLFALNNKLSFDIEQVVYSLEYGR